MAIVFKKQIPFTNSIGELNLFALDSGGAVLQNWQESKSPGGWHGWRKIGVGSFADLSVVMNGDGHLELFTLDAGGNSAHAWQTKTAASFDGGTWTDWEKLP
jgi:hypothetical protein